MADNLTLIIAGGVGLWAYSKGHLDGFLPEGWQAGGADRGDGGGDGSSATTPSRFTSGTGVKQTEEEVILLDNWQYVSPWSRANMRWTAAMMWAESRGNEKAVSHAGALGVMQVMPGTASDLYSQGNKAMMPTRENLLTEAGSIYFGTAYLQYLSSISTDRNWITSAYNAGPGGQAKTGNWPKETRDYLAAVQGRFAYITQLAVEA